jgi:Family of unknown function (DUF6262)
MNNEEAKESRINKLNQKQAARREDAAGRVHKAIERLQKTNAKINFPTVAREANVSTSYLYKYPETTQRIAELRSQQGSFPKPSVAKPNSSAQDKIAALLKERVARLEKENKELKRENQAVTGQLDRLHLLNDQVERQTQMIAYLQGQLPDKQSASNVTPISVNKKNTIDKQIQSELNSLGIDLNSTLTETIQSATNSTVLAAIELFKEQLNKTAIRNPGAWLSEAIKKGWVKSELIQQDSSKPEHQVITANNQSTKKLLSLDKLQEISSTINQKNERFERPE